MVPFGSPVPAQDETAPTHINFNKPLRVLFAGSMSQRKGLGDLFAAMRLLNSRNIELVVMGSPEAPMEFYRNEYPNFTFEPGRSQPTGTGPYENLRCIMSSIHCRRKGPGDAKP